MSIEKLVKGREYYYSDGDVLIMCRFEGTDSNGNPVIWRRDRKTPESITDVQRIVPLSDM